MSVLAPPVAAFTRGYLNPQKETRGGVIRCCVIMESGKARRVGRMSYLASRYIQSILTLKRGRHFLGVVSFVVVDRRIIEPGILRTRFSLCGRWAERCSTLLDPAMQRTSMLLPHGGFDPFGQEYWVDVEERRTLSCAQP